MTCFLWPRAATPLACLMFSLSSGLTQDSGKAEFKTCYASWSERELRLGNAYIERQWRISQGQLTAISFRDKSANLEWLAKPSPRPAPSPAGTQPAEPRPLQVSAKTGRLSPVEEESLVLELVAPGTNTFRYSLQIFPESHGIAMRFVTDAGPSATAPARTAGVTAQASGIETSSAPGKIDDTSAASEDFQFAPQHLRFTQVTLVDQTDIHNELAFEKEWLLAPNEAALACQGNLFFLEDPIRQAGLIFLRHSPLPNARPVKSDWDTVVYPAQRRVRFAAQSDPFVILAYTHGPAGRIQALHSWQRQLRAFDPKRDGMFLSNTWGDRGRDARINEAFMLKEIDAGARLGVDVVQIDDGWQQGMTANSARGKGAWNGFWAADPNFWQVNTQRFPHGLEPVVQAAREKGLRFGLWFAPDSSQQGTNWVRDAERLLTFHKNQGIDYFKIDGIKLTSPVVVSNLQQLFSRVLTESAGKVTFDLDVTAESRFGYFGCPQAGPLFVENRYTDFHRYWPHQTLRNFWKLAHYIDPLRLRLELLNNARNTKAYENDPLAPAAYPPDYLFATTMLANPLGWFEISNLPEDYLARVSRLVAVWKREREQLFRASLLPIGQAPDGTRWTGFASVAPDQRGGYVLLFRELNGQTEWSTELPLLAPGNYRVRPLAGEGSAAWEQGKLVARVPQAQRYLWVKLERE